MGLCTGGCTGAAVGPEATAGPGTAVGGQAAPQGWARLPQPLPLGRVGCRGCAGMQACRARMLEA